MSKKVVTFGEIMMRLTPPENQRFIQTDEFNVIYGGGEANVAVSCANYGLDAYFVTKLPENPFGQAALNEVRRYGVKTDYIARGGKRLGKYFCESGASQRSSNVIYDRAHSAIAEANSDDFNWDEIFSEAEWYHVTGITPALSEKMSEVTIESVKKAQEYDVTVSCDLNFRSKLWSQEEAKRVMSEVMEYVDVCIANEEDAEMTFGIESGSDIESGDINIEGYKDVAQQLIDRFDVDMVGSHLRVSHNASVNDWVVVLYDGEEFVKSTEYRVHIVDRVGGGDSFAGALIYSQLSGKDLQETVEFGAAASALKQSIPGDFNHMTLEEVEAIAEGPASGRVKR
ncbi:sugar kinase [Halarsenatibacter silvermanii]|uniref:2-dehydro-3-deoxygluconokinase n=1 Tax=Halarsenatibacter silvermanii TaxID=321763 RepID=A0A1G9TCQ6_9FIRM|nr:sugar kinase [Halarsenatibacter silvermanii]SDM45430.1 2-dehydro-3-deoxygluconokinase [Halarsenatibacter silvermanii]